MNNLKRIFWVLALIITSIILLPSNVKAIEITEIEIGEVEKPVVGSIPSEDVIVNAPGATKDDINSYWVRYDETTKTLTNTYEDNEIISTSSVREGIKLLFQIKLDANEGNTFASTLNVKYKGESLPFVDVNNPIKSAYAVLSDGSGTYILIEPQEVFKYSVTFDANGGKFSNDKTTLVIDEWEDEKLDNLEKPTKAGYTFLGFFTEKSGGTSIQNYIAEAGIDQNGLTFYAKWQENSSNSPGFIEKITVDFTKIKNIQNITNEEYYAFSFIIDKGLLKVPTDNNKLLDKNDKLLFTVDEDGKIKLTSTLTMADNISYSLTEEDIKTYIDQGITAIPDKIEIIFAHDIENPNTYDNISSSIIIGAISLIGLAGTIIYLKKRNKIEA